MLSKYFLLKEKPFTSTQLDTVRPFYRVSYFWDWMHSTLRPRVNECSLTYDQQIWKDSDFWIRCMRKPECLQKTYQGGYGIDKPKCKYNHWLAALVKGKCSSTKLTGLATEVVCHPDTEQNRPCKLPWLSRELNRGPTAQQVRTLPVCCTTLLVERECVFVKCIKHITRLATHVNV